MLKFSPANTKLQKLEKVKAIQPYLDDGRKVYSLDLLAGHTCPFAHNCLSRVIEGKIQDGKHTKFRCYAASLEVLYKNVYAAHKFNTDLVRAAPDIFSLLHSSMPKNLGVLRIHSSGDFFNQKYFDAYVKLAELNADRLFYAYTKNLNVWIKRKNNLPPNLVLTASYGGKLDHLIKPNKLRYAKVILYKEDSNDLEIDDNDSHAADPSKRNQNFCLLIHGQQMPNSEAQRALQFHKKGK